MIMTMVATADAMLPSVDRLATIREMLRAEVERVQAPFGVEMSAKSLRLFKAAIELREALADLRSLLDTHGSQTE